jgi:tetratricopeptide (TPR) repeat protein
MGDQEADVRHEQDFFPEIKSAKAKQLGAAVPEAPLGPPPRLAPVLSGAAAALAAHPDRTAAGTESYHSLNKRGMLLLGQGDLARAEPLLLRALAGMRAALGEQHAHTLHAACTAALLLQRRGDLAGAETLLRAAVRGKRARLREGHPDTLQTVSNLGALLYARGDIAAAEPMLREVRGFNLPVYLSIYISIYLYIYICLHVFLI